MRRARVSARCPSASLNPQPCRECSKDQLHRQCSAVLIASSVETCTWPGLASLRSPFGGEHLCSPPAHFAEEKTKAWRR